MLKIRRNSKHYDFHPKTQPDEAPNTSEGIPGKMDPQQSLFQISLKTNEQQYSRTFTCWQKQPAKTQSINQSGPTTIQQGCFNQNISSLRTNTVVLNKKEIYLKKWIYKRERQSQLKQSIRLSQKKKSCVSINFNLQNYNNKIHNSRIHSRTVAMPEYKKAKTGESQRAPSQIQCDFQQPKEKSLQKDKYSDYHTQRKTKIRQNQLLIHKKNGKKYYISKNNQKEQSQNNKSFVKYFTILNSLIAEEKQKVFSPIKTTCPNSKFKGIFQKRRFSDSK